MRSDSIGLEIMLAENNKHAHAALSHFGGSSMHLAAISLLEQEIYKAFEVSNPLTWPR